MPKSKTAFVCNDCGADYGKNIIIQKIKPKGVEVLYKKSSIKYGLDQKYRHGENIYLTIIKKYVKEMAMLIDYG